MTLADVPAQATTQLMEVADPNPSEKVARYYRLVAPQVP